MSPLKRHTVSAHEAVSALIECPPPWQPIRRDQGESYRHIVGGLGHVLVDYARARSRLPAWLLVRYLPAVPVELVERSLAGFKRETTEFCALVGDTPDFAEAEAWERQWRASLANGAASRRAAG